MTHLETENFLRSYLYKAKVLLVGGGPFNPEEFIDEGYDVWVRINNHYLIQGGRVDVLYTSGAQDPEEGLEHSIVVNCHPVEPTQEASPWESVGMRYLRYDTQLYQGANPYGPEHEWLNKLHRELDTMPLTGMIAVAHLLSMPIAELELTGFDFYQRMGIQPHHRDSHLLYPQIEWLGEQCAKDKRILVDEKLGSVVMKFIALKELRTAEYYQGVSLDQEQRLT